MNLIEFEHLKNFKILDIQSPHLIKKAVEIYEQGLGQKYISEEDLIKFTEDRKNYIVIGATVGSDLAGVMIAYEMSLEESSRYDGELEENNVPKVFSSRKVGLIKSVAVEKQYRHRGIGTKLIFEAMQRLKAKNCDLYFAVSWVSGLRDSSPSVFESLKFINAIEIPNYWTKDSIKEKYMCPVCGNPCKCPARFYFKTA